MKKIVLPILLSLLMLTACNVPESEPETVSLPSPVTSKTVASLPDINLDPPPISVVVPPVTSATTTAPATVLTRPETTPDPLASVSAVPLSEYLGITTAGTGSTTAGSTVSGVSGNSSVSGNSGTTPTVTAESNTATVTTIARVDENFAEQYPSRVIFRPFEYSALTNPQKKLYALMEDTFLAVTNEMVIPDALGVTSADFDTVFALFLNKEPHDYYLEPSASTRYSESTDKLYSVTFTYVYPKVTITSRNERTDTAVRDIVRTVNTDPNLKTDFDKIVWLFDYLAGHITYDSTSDDSNNIYGALVDGRADCMGYSFALKELANSLGIEAITVSGQNGAAVPHMWNMVKLDGNWYHLDATYGDTDAGFVNYDYCLTTDTRLLKSYTAVASLKAYPKAVMMEENYYVKNDLFASTKNEATEIIRRELTRAVSAGETCVQLMCATENVASQTEEALLGVSSADNIITILNAANTAGTVDIGKSSYQCNLDTGVIKILIVYN